MKIKPETNFFFSMFIRSLYLAFFIVLSGYAGAINKLWFTIVCYVSLAAALACYVFFTFHDAKVTILKKEK